ncbi:replication-relaxation family protein [Streptomyces sp. NBC_00005]|uniref:replication-relaxation family protein n=1 Tax=Streptomyces sp. NBC_00005 TaxID=2903609 RepID=UPI00324E440A
MLPPDLALLRPSVRIEQTRRRLARLRGEGLVERIALPHAGRLRVRFPTPYGAQLASEWPELRRRRPRGTVSDPTAARLKVGHTLAVTETTLLFLEDARRHGELCRPLDWIPEIHHPIGGREAVIPDALMYYQRGPADGERGSMLRAFVEVDRAPWAPNVSPRSCLRTSASSATCPRSRGAACQPSRSRRSSWRTGAGHYPLFPRLLFVLDGTGPAGVENRIDALRATARALARSFLHEIPVLAASLADLLQHGPSAPVWHPVHDRDQRVHWTQSRHP